MKLAKSVGKYKKAPYTEYQQDKLLMLTNPTKEGRKMLTKEFTRDINGYSTRIMPTGRKLTYCGTSATEIEYTTDYGTHLSSGKIFVPRNATRADIVEQLEGGSSYRSRNDY